MSFHTESATPKDTEAFPPYPAPHPHIKLGENTYFAGTNVGNRSIYVVKMGYLWGCATEPEADGSFGIFRPEISCSSSRYEQTDYIRRYAHIDIKFRDNLDRQGVIPPTQAEWKQAQKINQYDLAAEALRGDVSEPEAKFLYSRTVGPHLIKYNYLALFDDRTMYIVMLVYDMRRGRAKSELSTNDFYLDTFNNVDLAKAISDAWSDYVESYSVPPFRIAFCATENNTAEVCPLATGALSIADMKPDEQSEIIAIVREYLPSLNLAIQLQETKEMHEQKVFELLGTQRYADAAQHCKVHELSYDILLRFYIFKETEERNARSA